MGLKQCRAGATWNGVTLEKLDDGRLPWLHLCADKGTRAGALCGWGTGFSLFFPCLAHVSLYLVLCATAHSNVFDPGLMS